MDKLAETRSGFVSIIGAPNAGKSTLINQLVGAKISIVTHKVQTTRSLVRGIVVKDDAQIVFIDTPGIFTAKKQLDRAMVTTAWNGARSGDITMLIIDAQTGLNETNKALLQSLEQSKQPKVLVLNKIDRVERSKLLELAAKANENVAFDHSFMISALNGSGCDDLLDGLIGMLAKGPWYYPEEQISDMPMRNLAAEITREKVFLRLHDEIPYASTVETESWQERKDGSVRINQVIYVERDSQKKIVLGKSGATIKAIGQAARQELEQILEQKVHLFLFVKVRENWANDPERYREMGLDFSK